MSTADAGVGVAVRVQEAKRQLQAAQEERARLRGQVSLARDDAQRASDAEAATFAQLIALRAELHGKVFAISRCSNTTSTTSTAAPSRHQQGAVPSEALEALAEAVGNVRNADLLTTANIEEEAETCAADARRLAALLHEQRAAAGAAVARGRREQQQAERAAMDQRAELGRLRKDRADVERRGREALLEQARHLFGA